VAIFLNGSGPSGAYSRLLLPKVPVIAIGTTTMTTTTTTDQTGAQTTEQLPRTLFTVAVDQKQAQQIMLAQSSGELALALMGEEAKVKPDPGITTNNLFG
jgi:pilus assembly protein CpaB